MFVAFAYIVYICNIIVAFLGNIQGYVAFIAIKVIR